MMVSMFAPLASVLLGCHYLLLKSWMQVHLLLLLGVSKGIQDLLFFLSESFQLLALRK